jgi:iron(III) transport system permease protein
MDPLEFVQRMPGLRGLIALHARKILLGLAAVVVTLLVFPPIGMLLFSSVRSTKDFLPFETTAYTVANYIQVFTSHVTYRLLLNTAWYAIGTVIVALVLATVFAWFLERTNVPFRRFLFVLILAPMGIPGIINSMAWILLANPANGLLNVILRGLLGLEGRGPLNIYSIPGMIMVQALSFVPVMYIMISGVFSRLDPSLEEAARTSGARNWATFRRISMPLLAPALFAALIYYLVIGMETFETPAMLGMPKGIFVFATMIYYAVHPSTGLTDYGLASTYGVMLLVIAAVFIHLYSRYTRHTERFVTVTGRGYRPRLIDLGRWKFVPVVSMSGYFILAVAMPLLILFWTSFAPLFVKVSLSALPLLNLDAYREMVAYPALWVAAKNTLIIAATTGSVGMLIVTLVSWLSVRGQIPGAWVPERVSFVILGVPGVVLTLALIFVYTALPLPFYGTIWIIVVALVTQSLPFGTRLMNAAFLQLHRELEEAATASGAGIWYTFSRIVLPLLWPSFARGFLWMFVRSVRDTTVALMLYSVGNQTLGVTLWFLWVEDADFPLASAIAVPLIVVTTGLTFLVAKQTMLQK